MTVNGKKKGCNGATKLASEEGGDCLSRLSQMSKTQRLYICILLEATNNNEKGTWCYGATKSASWKLIIHLAFSCCIPLDST